MPEGAAGWEGLSWGVYQHHTASQKTQQEQDPQTNIAPLHLFFWLPCQLEMRAGSEGNGLRDGRAL